MDRDVAEHKLDMAIHKHEAVNRYIVYCIVKGYLADLTAFARVVSLKLNHS